MVYGAINLHARYSQIRIVDESGTVLRDQRVLTTAERLVHAFAGQGPLRILLEAGTESEWVAETLEGAGHTVIVADPNYAPMYGELRRKVKTDRRDVAALGEANRRGWYGRRIGCRRRSGRCARCCGVVGYWCRRGRGTFRWCERSAASRLPLTSCGAEAVPRTLATLALPPLLAETLAPLRRMVDDAERRDRGV